MKRERVAPRRITLATGLAAFVLVTACSRLPGAEPSNLANPSPTQPSATVDQVNPNEDGDMNLADLPAQSHWDRLATGDLPGALTLGDALAISDLVVVGRWVGLERGGSYSTPENETVEAFAVALIEVDDVIEGDPPEGFAGMLRVPFLLSLVLPGAEYPEAAFKGLDQARPSEPAVLFLQSWSSYFERAGAAVPDWVKALDRPDIYRTIGSDGSLPLEGGSVSGLTFEFDMPRWRTDLAGKDLETVRAALAGAEASDAP